MKLKDSLKIGGHDVRVLFPYSFQETADLNGQQNPETKVIRVAGKSNSGVKFPDSFVKVVLIHEVLHEINTQSGKFIFPDDEYTEGRIDALSEALYQVLHDNRLRF